jgi:diadenosine tetraphosphate (Ap4A) HIT family hydrolase
MMQVFWIKLIMTQTIFAKIIKGETPCDKVYETADVLAFHDINPVAKVHILVIPKKLNYANFDQFIANASVDEIASFWQAVNKVAEIAGIKASGFRLITNNGVDARQEVEHFHVHIIGGEVLCN